MDVRRNFNEKRRKLKSHPYRETKASSHLSIFPHFHSWKTLDEALLSARAPSNDVILFMKNETSSIFPPTRRALQTKALRHILFCVLLRLSIGSNFPHWINEKLFLFSLFTALSLSLMIPSRFSYSMTSFVKILARQVLLACWCLNDTHTRSHQRPKPSRRTTRQTVVNSVPSPTTTEWVDDWARAHFLRFYVHMTS